MSLKKSYRKEAMQGAKWTSIASLLISIGGFLLIIVLTNLIDKKDFGLFALVNIVVLFAGEFVDIGISQAIIQKKNVNKKQLSTLYWINIILCLVVFIFINISNDLIADFYNQKDLSKLLELISFSFLFSGFSSQFQALIKKNLNFISLSLIQIISFVAYIIVSIFLAYSGFGVYALIWGALARSFSKSFMLIFTGIKYHIPNLYFNLSDVKDFISFGSFRTGSFLLSFFQSQLDIILLGKLVEVEDLGVYDVFKRIVKQPIRLLDPLTKIVFYPILSLVHEKKARITEMFIKIIKIQNLILAPIYIFILFIANEALSIFLGVGWSSNYFVLQLLSLVFFFRANQKFVGISIISSGKPNWTFYNNLIQLPLNILCIFIGSNWGLVGIATSYLILSLLTFYPKFYFFIRPLYSLNFKHYFWLIFKDLLIILSFSLIFSALLKFSSLNDSNLILIKFFGFTLFLLLFAFYLKKDLITYLKNLIFNDK